MAKTIIMLHHSATWDDKQKKDFDAIKAGHLAIGDRDIGYHWLIEYADNQIQTYQGRQEWESAAACPNYNNTAIHICLVGNFEESTPTEEQYRAVADKCRDIMTRWPIEVIGGHRDYYATACPGANYDVDYVRELVKGEDAVMDVNEALKVLLAKGVLSDLEYWKKVADVVKYQEQLYINMAKALK